MRELMWGMVLLGVVVGGLMAVAYFNYGTLHPCSWVVFENSMDKELTADEQAGVDLAAYFMRETQPPLKCLERWWILINW